MFGYGEQPAWFDGAIKRVLDGAHVLSSASDPRALDQLTAELVGAELDRALQGGVGLRFDWWFGNLVEATVERIEQSSDVGGKADAYQLLHGLAAQFTVPKPLMARAAAAVRGAAVEQPPDWLSDVPRIAATGRVWRLRDAYGTRLGVIAEFAYPGGASPLCYLLDIDASGFVVLADAGVYDDPGQAATAWRDHVGDSAEGVRLEAVDGSAGLQCLVQLDAGAEMTIRGDEPRRVLDNWFRAQTRINQLARALRSQGRPLPPAISLYRDVDTTALTEPFVAWYTRTHRAEPDPEVVDALAGEWMEGALPETWFSVSPARVEFQLTLTGDWIPDDPVTVGAIALLPEWVGWLGERAGLASHLYAQVVVAAQTPAG